MQYVERSGWTSSPRPAGLTRLDPAEVRGVAIHYTGSKASLGATATLATSVRRLEAERRFHTAPPPAGRGWADIAYQVAQDVEGRVFDARGIAYRSAANGDATVNRRYGAVTWLLGVGDQPTPAMVAAFLEWRERYWLARYPRAVEVVGHRDLHPTRCPDEPTYALIRSGRLTRPAARPTQPEDDDMAMTDAQLDALADKVAARLEDRVALRVIEGITSIKARNPVRVDPGTGAAKLPDGGDIDALPTVVGELQTEQREQGVILRRIAAALSGAGK